jgi:hypothetical protein
MVALLVSVPIVTPAQTPGRIDACYVPVSGTIYRRNTTASPAPGAPANCLTPAHVPFEIQNGSGTIGPDLVFSGKIEMGKSASFGGSLLAKDATDDPTFVPSGAGKRFMWLGSRAALRAGTASGSEWNMGYIGEGSTAIGRDVRATAIGSMALGSQARANHDGAVVINATTGTQTAFSLSPGELVLSGQSGVRLVPLSTPDRDCSVLPNAVLQCDGGMKLGTSIVRNLETADISASSTTSLSAGCPFGYVPVGGGVNTEDGDMKVRESYPLNFAWYASVRNDHPFNGGRMTVHVVCARQ